MWIYNLKHFNAVLNMTNSQLNNSSASKMNPGKTHIYSYKLICLALLLFLCSFYYNVC